MTSTDNSRDNILITNAHSHRNLCSTFRQQKYKLCLEINQKQVEVFVFVFFKC